MFKPVSIHTSQLLRGALLALVAAQGALPLRAGGPEDAALASLMAMRGDLGLDQNHGFRLRGTHKDALGQSHVRFQQTYKGLNVFGGEAITHRAKGGPFLPLTYALKQDIDLSVTPSLQYSEALAIAYADLNPKGPFASEPTVTWWSSPSNGNEPRFLIGRAKGPVECGGSAAGGAGLPLGLPHPYGAGERQRRNRPYRLPG